MSPLHSQAGLLVVCVFAYQVIGQEIQKTIVGCISDNVTLSFDLPEKKDHTVDSYIWYKQDVSGDPSFAKYTVAENKFEIYRDAQDRLLHNHNDPLQLRNLVLLNVQKSDVSKYFLVINYVNVTQQTSEYLLRLSVKDLCFGKPEQVDGCVVSTCFTGENGNLTTFYGDEKGTTQTVNGYTEVRNCTSGVSVGYSCCNTAGNCEEQMLIVPEETTVVEQKITKDHSKNVGSSHGTGVSMVFGVLIGLELIVITTWP
ncbi:uncharacterized protein LOC134258775 isoform X2 [Saccostrea cucullata]|uniref:uncharacterized protein LOC134258775 isoform X2 n=1 Tax=Saccostrea cuccullata TaxID=36930 RepID=UPI002ED60703